MSTAKRNVGFVFQHYAVFKHDILGLEIRRKKWKAEIVEQIIHGYIPSLSGGQRQRMAYRPSAVEPTVLLLDELRSARSTSEGPRGAARVARRLATRSKSS